MEPLRIEEEGDVCPSEIRSPRLPRHPPLLADKKKRSTLQLATTIVRSKDHQAALHTKVYTFAVQRVTFICQRFAMTEHRDLTFSCVGPGRPFGSRIDGARRSSCLGRVSSSLDPPSLRNQVFLKKETFISGQRPNQNDFFVAALRDYVKKAERLTLIYIFSCLYFIYFFVSMHIKSAKNSLFIINTISRISQFKLSHVSVFQRKCFYFFSSNLSRSVNFITTADHFGAILSSNIFGSDKMRLVCGRRVSDDPDIGKTGAYKR
ncbi:hypothetical protein ALC53_11011 [Atta colombica]|uniref:Uncharacterized protein n=1 Tax=Atta colombica TaxID=520822 RepID=A0A195B1L2_9HYME|nr:hypothetical protein ALC53_11011 [Atta colombica]